MPVDVSVNADMNGFAGKFVRLTFNGADATPRDVREVKLYGAHSTAGFISTSGWNSELINPVTEKFGTAVTGLPSGWRTYGDFTWFVDTGVHQSGTIFTGDSIGSGDFSAVRTQRNSPPNSSGILEVDVNLTGQRDINFALKWDFQGNVSSFQDPNSPVDDFLFLHVITPTGLLDLTNSLYSPPTITPWDWRKISVSLGTAGTNTIRWIYKRGSKQAGAPLANAEAAVWIDNVAGLDPRPGFPNLKTSLWGYTNAGPPLENEVINAVISGVEVESGVINAYVLPLSGLPTESINAYHIGEFKESGVVYGYVNAAREFGDTYGYVEGFLDTPSEMINGYIFTSGAFETIYGHMQNRLFETINGYLMGPSGALDSINAYIATPQFLAVNGYMKVTEDETVEVNAYLKANGFGDQINGFMFGSGLTHQSYGYINADGAVESFNAWMKTGDREQIAAYIKGAEGVSGVINAYMSGVSAVADVLNGYIPGISGTISESVNGFIEAVDLPQQNINGFVIGFGGSGECNFPVPMPPFVASPTGNFFS
jgi:hypothetical protein